MLIGIYSRALKSKDNITIFLALAESLSKHNLDCAIYYTFKNYLVENNIEIKNNWSTFGEIEDEYTWPDFIISIGGDGTILDTLTIVKNIGTPVLGINTGRLGYLATCNSNDYEKAILELKNKSYSIDKRSVLKLESNQENIFEGMPYALNDIVIHKKDSASMITVHTFLNGEFLNSYWSDGIIVATPTGSSAYSLSCGGPIIVPKSQNFVITPIAPHNLSLRPVIIPDDTILSFEVEGRVKSYLLTLDSRSYSIKKGTQLAVKKANFTFNLIRLSNDNYLQSLRNKMNWGIDIRK